MPPVCLPVGDLEMAHCCMPYALSHARAELKASQLEEKEQKIWKVHLSCSEQNGLTFYEWEKGSNEGCLKAHCSFSSAFFFFIVKYIYLQPLWKAQKAAWQPKTCFLYVRISLCDTRGKMLFFTPNCCLWNASVKKFFGLQSEIDKSSNMRSACSYFRSVGAAWEFRICLCDSGSQLLSALKCECAKCMRRSTPESRRVFSAEFACYEITSAQWGARCTA